jgi:hypothetical protein
LVVGVFPRNTAPGCLNGAQISFFVSEDGFVQRRTMNAAHWLAVSLLASASLAQDPVPPVPPSAECYGCKLKSHATEGVNLGQPGSRLPTGVSVRFVSGPASSNGDCTGRRPACAEAPCNFVDGVLIVSVGANADGPFSASNNSGQSVTVNPGGDPKALPVNSGGGAGGGTMACGSYTPGSVASGGGYTFFIYCSICPE